MSTQNSSPGDSQPAKDTKAVPPEIRLLPAALFFTANSKVPAGIRARDMMAMVQGLVEEHSPLPIEMTAWGFLLDNKAKTDSHFLYYAAPRDLLFKNAEAAADLRPTAVLPAFAALQGLHFKEPTWVFLSDSECLSAVRFEPDSSVPSRIEARFHQTGTGTDIPLFDLRQKLLEAVDFDPNGEAALKGLIRIGEAHFDRKGLHFKLERQTETGNRWESWKKTRIAQKNRRFAADVRDRAALSAHERNEGSGQRIRQVAALVLLALLVLAGLEVVQYQRMQTTTALSEKAEGQTALVDRLQEIEAMSKSLKEIFDRRFEPYRWLMVVNEVRPEKSLSLPSLWIHPARSAQVAAHPRFRL